MSVRFTSGSVGRLTFEHANRMADAADAVESMPIGDRIATKPIEPTFVVARLTQRSTMTIPSGNYEVWNWVEIGVTGTRQARSVSQIPKGITSNAMGEHPIGRAIKIAGRASPNDLVILFPMKDETGESWYAFVGGLGMTGSASLLEITGHVELESGIFRYDVSPVYINASGMISPNPMQPSGVAFNVYELSGNHDQPLEFDDPPSRLRVLGPVKGPVVGVLSSEPRGDIVWTFEAPSPLGPECVGPVAGAFGNLLNGGI